MPEAPDDQTEAFRRDVLAGLAEPIPAIPARWLYDRTGSELFDAITRLPEYYPTKTETALLHKIMPEVAVLVPKGSAVVEFGAGSATKTPILLKAIAPAAYVPVDISGEALRGAAGKLRRLYPWLDIRPVHGDFSRPLKIPVAPKEALRPGRRVVYFPGSTIGNLSPQEAHAFLRMTRGQVGPDGAMLIGVDLKKDATLLHAAYNDAKGVTAAFNLNLLARINRELGGSFRLRRFAHYAFYNPPPGRVEMHLVSLARQSVDVGDHRFDFEAGESIHTENSYKYTIEEFRLLARSAGFRGEKTWLDAKGHFALHGLVAA